MICGMFGHVVWIILDPLKCWFQSTKLQVVTFRVLFL